MVLALRRDRSLVDELVGWHTAKIGDRWAALEPLRQGVRHVFGRFAKDVARGLRIRCDWGPQYIADAWINEVKWLGMRRKRRKWKAKGGGQDKESLQPRRKAPLIEPSRTSLILEIQVNMEKRECAHHDAPLDE